VSEAIAAAVAGFVAELVDGSLGMAYGVTASTLLQAAGFRPSLASAVVHAAEVPLTAVSGVSHFKLGNVDKSLLLKLAIPGSLAATLGAIALSKLEVPWLATAVRGYLLATGLVVLLKAFGVRAIPSVNPVLLGAVGGFADAVGGGGWGPIVAGTLIVAGDDHRSTVGSVNAAKFFVTASQTVVFLYLLGTPIARSLVPFILGGLVAAPLGAWLCRTLGGRRRRVLYLLVGLLLVTTNAARLLAPLT
jgi:uncharacterized membrane protein YfcA